MQPTAEIDPQARIGIGVTRTALAASLAIVTFPGDALAQENSVDIEKQALAAFGNAHTKTIDSFPLPNPASLATSQVIEAPTASSSSNETLVPGRKGLISADRSSVAADPALEQLCVKAGLARPKVIEALLAAPGDRKKQGYRYEGRYRSMPKVCHGLYSRTVQVKFDIENSENNKQHFKVSGYIQPAGDGEFLGDEGGVVGAGFGTFSGELPEGSHKLYRCTDGRGVTDAFVTGRQTVKYIPNGNVVAREEVFTKKMEIQSTTYKGPLSSGRLKGPC